MAGFFRFSPAEILSRDSRAAGGKGGKGVDQQHIYRIHQGDGGDCRLSHLRDHHGVEQSNGNGEQLLNDQRDNEPPQVLFRKVDISLPDFHVFPF